MAPRLTLGGSKRLLPAFLSATAGAVDVIGFLALGGLFTAHITGNVVIVAAHYVSGGFSEVGPLLAVPVFVAVLGVVTLASVAVEKAGYRSRRALLALQAALLGGCLGLGVGFGPFADADRPMAVVVGTLAVAAMATQNVLVKLALPGTPSTAVMTTNMTRLTVDLVTLARGLGKPDDLAKVRHRASVTWPCVAGFVAGCTAGAVLEVHCGLWALALPVALAVLAVPLSEVRVTAQSSLGPQNRQTYDSQQSNERRHHLELGHAVQPGPEEPTQPARAVAVSVRQPGPAHSARPGD
jgi:uncharacterized membrane protein YoaK (UPF0700 family)